MVGTFTSVCQCEGFVHIHLGRWTICDCPTRAHWGHGNRGVTCTSTSFRGCSFLLGNYLGCICALYHRATVLWSPCNCPCHGNSEVMINTSGSFALFTFQPLDVSIYYFCSPLLDTFRSRYSDLPAIIMILIPYTILQGQYELQYMVL